MELETLLERGDISDLRKLSISQRMKLIELIRASIEDEDQPAVPTEPFHREAVLDELKRFREDGDRGEPAIEALERIREAL